MLQKKKKPLSSNMTYLITAFVPCFICDHNRNIPCKLKLPAKCFVNKLVWDSFSSNSSESYRKVIAEKDKRAPGWNIFPCFWQQVCNKKNAFYENVIIHSKMRVGVTMKNSSSVDALSRNNKSKRKATGVTENAVSSDKLCLSNDEQTH